MNYEVNYGTIDANEADTPYDDTFFTYEEAKDVAAQLADEYPFVDVWKKTPRPNGTAFSECVLSYEDGTLTEDGVVFEWNCEKMSYLEV